MSIYHENFTMAQQGDEGEQGDTPRKPPKKP